MSEMNLTSALGQAKKLRRHYGAFEHIEEFLKFVSAQEGQVVTLKKEQEKLEGLISSLKSTENRAETAAQAAVDKHAKALSDMDEAIKKKQADQRKRETDAVKRADARIAEIEASQRTREDEYNKAIDSFGKREAIAEEATEKAEKRLASFKKSLEKVPAGA